MDGIAKPGFLTEASEWLLGVGVLGALAAAAYAVDFAWRHSSYTDQGRVAVGPLLLSVVSIAALGASGYLGGRLAYRYGVRVADEHTQAEGFVRTSESGTDSGSEQTSRHSARR